MRYSKKSSREFSHTIYVCATPMHIVYLVACTVNHKNSQDNISSKDTMREPNLHSPASTSSVHFIKEKIITYPLTSHDR